MNNNMFKVHGICMIYQLLFSFIFAVATVLTILKIFAILTLSWNFIIILASISMIGFFISFMVAVINMIKNL